MYYGTNNFVQHAANESCWYPKCLLAAQNQNLRLSQSFSSSELLGSLFAWEFRRTDLSTSPRMENKSLSENSWFSAFRTDPLRSFCNSWKGEIFTHFEDQKVMRPALGKGKVSLRRSVELSLIKKISQIHCRILGIWSKSETDLFAARVKSDRFRDKSVPFYKPFNPSVAIGLLVVDNTTNSNG